MDCNPYLGIAASLACGYLGLVNRIDPKPQFAGDAYDSGGGIPRDLSTALDLFDAAEEIHEVLHPHFCSVYSSVKRLENGAFLQVISPWEREHLLLQRVSWLHANGDRGVWTDTWYGTQVELPAPFPVLETRRTCDLVVIGAGLTGLSAALHAARRGLSVIVLEAQRVGWGASGRNGGQLGSGFNWSQRKLAAKLGDASARALRDLAEEGKADARAFMDGAGYRPGVISACLTPKEFDAARTEADWMAKHYGTHGADPRRVRHRRGHRVARLCGRRARPHRRTLQPAGLHVQPHAGLRGGRRRDLRALRGPPPLRHHRRDRQGGRRRGAPWYRRPTAIPPG